MASYSDLIKEDWFLGYWCIGASSTSTGQSLPPTMKFVPVLGNHCCQTLSAVAVCPSLAISTDLRPLNTSLATAKAKRRAQDRAAWRQLLKEGSSGESDHALYYQQHIRQIAASDISSMYKSGKLYVTNVFWFRNELRYFCKIFHSLETSSSALARRQL